MQFIDLFCSLHISQHLAEQVLPSKSWILQYVASHYHAIWRILCLCLRTIGVSNVFVIRCVYFCRWTLTCNGWCAPCVFCAVGVLGNCGMMVRAQLHPFAALDQTPLITKCFSWSSKPMTKAQEECSHFQLVFGLILGMWTRGHMDNCNHWFHMQ